MFDFKWGEKGKVVLCWAMLTVTAIGFTFGWIFIHSVLVKRIGIEYLPYTYVAMNFFFIIGSWLYVMFADRVSREKMLTNFALVAAILLFFCSVFVLPPSTAEILEVNFKVVLYFSIILLALAFSGYLIPMQIWIIINDAFRPRQGRKYYPFFALAWLVGGFIGGLFIDLSLSFMSINNILFLWVASLLLVIFLNKILFNNYSKDMTWVKILQIQIDKKEQWKSIYDYIKNASAIKIIAIGSIFFWIVWAFQDFQYTQVMNISFATEDELASFFATYSIIWNALAVPLQFFIAEKLLLNLGVFRGLIVLPLVSAISFFLLVSHFGFWQGLTLRIGWDVVMIVIQTNAYQLAFNVVPSHLRGRVRGFCDGMVNALAGMAGGGILILFQYLFKANQHISINTYLSILGALLSLIWLGIVFYSRHYYVNDLVTNLKAKDKITLMDSLESLEERREPLADEVLLSILSSENNNYGVDVKAKVMEVLSRLGNIDDIRTLSLWIEDPNQYLRISAVRALATFRNIEKYPFVFHYVNEKMRYLFSHDSSVPVRLIAGNFIIKHHPKDTLPKFVAELLNHSDYFARVMVVKSLNQLDLKHVDLLLLNTLDDPECIVRAEAIVTLWPYKEYESRIAITLRKLLDSEITTHKKEGLKALLRVKPARDSFLPYTQKLLKDDNSLIRAMAILSALTMVKNSDENWKSLISQLMEILVDPPFDGTERNEFFALVQYIDDDILDAIYEVVLSLPQQQRKLAQRGMEQIAHNLYSGMASE